MRNDDIPYDLWTLGEQLVGHGYSSALIEVEEDTQALDQDERFKAWLTFDPEKVRNPDAQAKLRNLRYSTVVHGNTREDVLKYLSEKLRNKVIQSAFESLKSALPYELTREFDTLAKLWLGVSHRVFLGSKDETPEGMAYNLLSREHFDTVKGHVDSIRSAIRDGEITCADDLVRQIDEIEVIYTHNAMNLLRVSDNNEEWKEIHGENEPFPGWEAAATLALQADVRESLGRHGIDPNTITQKDCARCGDVAVFDEDEENCPKCNLDFNVAEADGFVSDEHFICADCYEGYEEAFPNHAKIMDPRREFACDECRGDFITPKVIEPVAAPEATPEAPTPAEPAAEAPPTEEVGDGSASE